MDFFINLKIQHKIPFFITFNWDLKNDPLTITIFIPITIFTIFLFYKLYLIYDFKHSFYYLMLLFYLLQDWKVNSI